MIEGIVYEAAKQAIRWLAFAVAVGMLAGAAGFAVWIYLL